MCQRWQLVVITCALTSMSMPGLLQASTDTPENNRQLITRHFELMNGGKWREAAEMFATDVRHHLGAWPSGQERIVQGKDLLIQNLDDIYRTFPDWKMEIVDMVADSASVVVRCHVSGTHKGTGTKRINGGFLMGVKPTDKHFDVQHMHWYRIHDGMITDHFAGRDDLGMTQQLGLLPRPSSPTPQAR